MRKAILILFWALSLASCKNSGYVTENNKALRYYQKAYFIVYLGDISKDKAKNKVLDYLDKALELDPDNIHFLDLQQTVYLVCSDYANLIKLYKLYATFSEGNGRYVANIGKCYDMLGQRDSAVYYYNKALTRRMSNDVFPYPDDYDQKMDETAIKYLITNNKEIVLKEFFLQVDTTKLNVYEKEQVEIFVKNIEHSKHYF